jgi:YHS domain-containing protein
MSVDNTVEDTVHYKGKIYGFCGAHCKESFKEDPAKYVKE